MGDIELDPKRVSPLTDDAGVCPICGGTDIRVKFADSLSPIHWCPDCMTGVGAGESAGIAVDMRVFPTAIQQREVIMRERLNCSVNSL